MGRHDERTRVGRIAALNDELRRTGRGGRTVVTRAVATLPADMLDRLLDAVRTFDAFDERNDPHGERDMALLTLDGDVFAWRIDYFDSDMICGSPDPTDDAVSKRVLTIMASGDL